MIISNRSLLIVILFLNAKFSFASSVGIMEYTKSPAELEHTAVIYPKTVDKVPQICYSVCGHEQEVGMTCADNKRLTSCIKQKSYFDELSKSFQIDNIKLLSDRLEWNEKNLARFRTAIETNGGDTQSQVDYMAAIKVVDDLRAQITTLKTAPNYLAYQKVTTLLTDGDEENALGYTVNRASNWDSWRFLVRAFWTFRMENVLAVWERERGLCEFHAGGNKVTQAQKLGGNCLSSETLATLRTWTVDGTPKRGPLKEYFDTYWDGYIEVRAKVQPVPDAPPSKP